MISRPRIAAPLATALAAWAAAVTAACSQGGVQASPSERGGGQEGGGPGGGARITSVAAAPVERRDLSRRVTVAGTIEPLRTIGVNSQMSGTVLAVRAEEGDRVRAGHVLAELDARETESQLARARAVLAGAEAAYERSRQLHAGQIITDAERDQARSAYEVAKSDVELWSTRLAFSRITAPAGGVVVAKLVEAGSAVSPNQRVFDLADVSLLVVRVQLSELDVVHLRGGAAVQVQADAYPGVALAGRIRRVFPAADPESRLVPIEVALEPAPRGVEVRPGFLARVTFTVDRRDQALVVPAPAVGVAETGTFVYVVQGDTLVRRPVTVGVTLEGWVEVREGLAEGQQVVTSGHTNLRPGVRVQVARDTAE